MHKLVLRWVKEYGANVRVRLAWRHIIIVTEVCLLLPQCDLVAGSPTQALQLLLSS